MGLFTSYRLRSRDAATRARAARTLGVAGKTSNVPSLEPLLDDEDPGVRRAAVEALGAIGGEGVAPHILRAARAADQVRPGTEAAALRASAVEALAVVGEPAVPALLGAVSDRHTPLRECAVEALARIGGDAAAQGLRQALADDRSALRQMAAAALARSAGAGAVPDLARALGHKDPATRRAVAEALGETGAVEAVGPLRRALDDPERTVRAAAVQALAAIGRGTAIDALVGALSRPDRDLRQAAAQALRASNWTPADDGQHALQAVLLGTFEAAGGEVTLPGPAKTAVVGLLQAALADKDPSTRTRAAAALGRIRTPEAAASLGSLLGDPDPATRAAAAAGLVALGPAVVEAVLPALEDRSASTRSAGMQVIEKVGFGRVADHLIARLSAGDAATHGGLPLRVVARLEALDEARHAADALERLLHVAGRSLPRAPLQAAAGLADVVLIEPGQVPDAAERLDLEELRTLAGRVLASAGAMSPDAPGASR